MRLLENKRILVTGGSRGIGAGVVRGAMAEGAHVGFIYQQSEDLAQDLAQEMTALHPEQRCLAFRCDIADTAATREMVKSAVGDLGGIDALVNNAGITRDAGLARMRREHWDK